MADAGIGAGGSVYIELEDTYGTYKDPDDVGAAGVWMPILSETLAHTEEKYYSGQIRHEVVDAEQMPGYYHIEGDLVFEVDPQYLPYFLVASRHTVTQSVAPAPYIYTAEPSKIGSQYPGGTGKGLSISIWRNGVGHGYSGCVVNQYAFTIETGTLRCTASMLGLKEQEPSGDDTGATFTAPVLYGADASSVYTDTAGAAPAFASAVTNFNGITATINHNGAAQNRIVEDRAATYISYGKTEATIDSEFDFLDRTDYDNYVASTKKAYRLQSINGVTRTWVGCDNGVQITYRNASFDSYAVGLSGLADLIMATINARALVVTGAAPYTILCKSSVDLGL